MTLLPMVMTTTIGHDDNAGDGVKLVLEADEDLSRSETFSVACSLTSVLEIGPAVTVVAVAMLGTHVIQHLVCSAFCRFFECLVVVLALFFRPLPGVVPAGDLDWRFR